MTIATVTAQPRKKKTTAVEDAILAARDAGCPLDQTVNFLRAGIFLSPRQYAASAAARECDRPDGPTEVAYGGARGGGKSFWGLSQVVADDCRRFPGLKFLYLRKVGYAAREAIHDLRMSVLGDLPHSYKVQEGRIVLENGSQVILGHFQYEKDVDNYLGLEYDGALIEEATQLSTAKVKAIGTCVRTSKEGWRPRSYFTFNPGGIGHGWVKARFIAPMRKGAETATRFIQATVRDNPAMNPEYIANLENLTGWQRKAWLDGDWDIAAGQYFTNFRHEDVVRELGPLPRHWRVWLGFDYGFQHFTSVHLLALDGDGNLWVVDEHAERGWLPEQHVAAIKRMLGRHRLEVSDLEATLAGPDCFNRDRRGVSTADEYERLGLMLERADADRINGAAEMLRRFGSPEATPPRAPTISIDPRCARLIECIPSLQRDDLRPEDVLKVDVDDDGLGGDDAYDSVRYGLMHASAGRGGLVANPFGELR